MRRLQNKDLVDDDGGIVHMHLGDHLDELRTRMGLALRGFVVAFIASLAAGANSTVTVSSPTRTALVILKETQNGTNNNLDSGDCRRNLCRSIGI